VKKMDKEINGKYGCLIFQTKTDTWGHMAGVNVTIGLPIVRTSVDHGTAFGKAGEGCANPQSMIEAIKLAAQLSRQ